jgi:hypothetical protein
MFQFSLCLDGVKKVYKEKIYFSLKNFIDSINGVCTIFDNGISTYILVGANEKIEFVVDKIKKIVIFVIFKQFKYEFLKNNLKLVCNDLNYEELINALNNFDINNEKKYVLNKLNIQNELVISSFYYFKLQELRKKWKELVDLANNNISYLVINSQFIDILKFIISNLDIKEKVIKINYKDYNFIISNEQTELVRYKGKDSNKFVITTLIELNPEKIYLSNLNNFPDIIHSVCELFEDRVYFN